MGELSRNIEPEIWQGDEPGIQLVRQPDGSDMSSQAGTDDSFQPEIDTSSDANSLEGEEDEEGWVEGDDEEGEHRATLYSDARQAVTKEISPTDSVRAYMQSIGKVALLTAEDEVVLSKRIEAGLYAGHLLAKFAEADAEYGPVTAQQDQYLKDLRYVERDGQRAKIALMEANLRLVVNLAKRYQGKGMPLLDLIQEGNLGLVRAVEKFDYMKGFKFSTYATWWIRQAITRGMADQTRTIRIPVHLAEQVNKYERIKRELNQKHSRPPTIEEIAEEMDISVKKIEEFAEYSVVPYSLDHMVGDNYDTPSGDLLEIESIGVDGEVEHMLSHDQLMKEIDGLEDEPKLVVLLRFGLLDGDPQTLEQVGARIGKSKERVRQIQRMALLWLSKGASGRNLRDYAEDI